MPRGTPAGSYTATFTVTRTSPADGDAATRRATVPLVLTVRDMDLKAADAAFFTWYHTVPASGEAHQGDPSALFGAEEIYFADQRRHGMNTVALHCYAEGLSKDGQVRVSLNELDAMVERRPTRRTVPGAAAAVARLVTGDGATQQIRERFLLHVLFVRRRQRYGQDDRRPRETDGMAGGAFCGRRRTQL